jgi:pentatricopeptide repeat protein
LKALELFRELDSPSIVTYNATMTALEKSLQWERALDLFQEMKEKNMPITVVSYGSAISACEKGLQYRQCLEFLDEMTEMGIKKNVIIFGAAMATMTASCRADIAFLLMERMKLEDVAPNVHIFNSAISACARCSLWEKGYELFLQMDEARVKRDVVTYNAVLDAVATPQPELGRKLFHEGIEKGFYARVSRIGQEWLELDVHFLSLGGGEIALVWWFEECLRPYLEDTSKLESVKSIAIVTGYGKTRAKGARMNDDGMRKRVAAMLECMDLKESPQPNKGRIHIDKEHLIDVAKRHGGKIVLDQAEYMRFKDAEITAHKVPDVPQQVRPRFRPARPDEGPPGTFIRVGDTLPDHASETGSNKIPLREPPVRGMEADFGFHRKNDGYMDNRGGGRFADDYRVARPSEVTAEDIRSRGYRPDPEFMDRRDRRSGYDELDQRGMAESCDFDRQGGRPADYDSDRRGSQRGPDQRYSERPARDYDPGGPGSERFRDDDHDRKPRPFMNDNRRRSSYDDTDQRGVPSERERNGYGRYLERDGRPFDRDNRMSEGGYGEGYRDNYSREPTDAYRTSRSDGGGGNSDDRSSYRRHMLSGSSSSFRAVRDDPELQASYREEGSAPLPEGRKRTYDDYNKQQAQSGRGYDVQPAFMRRRNS